MTRFFVRPEQISGNLVTLDGSDTHHLRAVLKAQAGDKIAVLDGSGQEWPAVLMEVGKTKSLAQMREPVMLHTEPVTKITVAQALPRVGDKSEQVWQRGTEVGVSHFWAFESARSLTHLTGERHVKRLGRWAEIIKTAAEQAHRAILPTLRADGFFSDVLAAAPEYDLTLLAHAEGTNTFLPEALTNLPTPPKSVLIVIGPESGFGFDEVKAAQAAGVSGVSLGPRTLRTETAALVMAAQILYALEPTAQTDGA